MSKISHFTAVGLLVASGYSLSLGAEGRAQIAGMSEVVTDSVASVIDEVKQLSNNIAVVSSNISFANVYSVFGVLSGAVPEGLPTLEAAVSNGVVVVEQESNEAAFEQAQQIKASFSDIVKVQPDATKKSGTITPVFKGVEGQNYTYVIVPVKK